MKNKNFSQNPFEGLDPKDFPDPKRTTAPKPLPKPKTENEELLERFEARAGGKTAGGAADEMTIRNLQKELGRLQQKCESFSAARENAEKRADALREELAVVKRKLAEVQVSLTSAKKEIDGKSGTIADLEGKRRKADETIDKLKKSMSAMERDSAAPASALLTRPAKFGEMFSGELADMILDMLDESLKNAENAGRVRRMEAVKAVLEANAADGELARRQRKLKSILKNSGTFNDQRTLDELAKLGIRCVSGRTHWKLKYGRHDFTLSKTPSDRRGNENSANDMINRFL